MVVLLWKKRICIRPIVAQLAGKLQVGNRVPVRREEAKGAALKSQPRFALLLVTSEFITHTLFINYLRFPQKVEGKQVIPDTSHFSSPSLTHCYHR
ncbi:MAG: hypothetical protein A2076_11005 [Geobacteraceae bacterium GWC2_53_11]|nr:MAG: hypothetical protein A2076_11005 [Geobacteraceae bacterium GWC2_53_11]